MNVFRPRVANSLFALRFPGAEVEQCSCQTGFDPHPPSTRNDWAKVRRTSRPGEWLMPQAPEEKLNQLKPMTWKIEEQQPPISNRVGSRLFNAVARFRRVNDECSRNMNGAVAERNQAGERILFLTTPERSAPAETFIKDFPTLARRLAQRHVGANSQAPKGCDFKPFGVLVAEGTSGFFFNATAGRIWIDGLPCHHSDTWVRERLKQMSQPGRSWNGVIVQEYNNFGVAFGQSTIARTAEATNWLN